MPAHRIRLILLAALVAVLWLAQAAARAEAKVVGKMVEYRQGDTRLEGYLAYDDARAGKRPGVLVVHEWWGLNDFVKGWADQLAGMGYVAFAADMYGKGKATTDMKQAAALAGALRANNQLLRERARAGLDVLATQQLVDPQRLAAMGFCFGGGTVLELAYSGAPLQGVVSFHGSFPQPSAQDLKRIQAKILVLHGAEDPTTPAEGITAFKAALGQAGVDWQVVDFGGAVHGFTNPNNGTDKSRGVAYNESAARRSLIYLKDFFQEIFAPK